MKKLLFILQAFFSSCILLINCNEKITNSIKPGIPISIIFDKNLSDGYKQYIEKAITSINNGISYGRNKWAVEVSMVQMSLTPDLINTVCKQMSRGVLALFGATSPTTSANTIRSLTNFYDLPFISYLSSPRKDYFEQLRTDFQNKNKKLKIANKYKDIIMSVVNKRSIEENLPITHIDFNETESENATSLKKTASADNKEEVFRHSQIFLRPDIVPVLIEMIKYYKWPIIYFIYNHDSALSNLDSLLDNQNKRTFDIEKILVRKITDISNCRDMLRSIEWSANTKLHSPSVQMASSTSTTEASLLADSFVNVPPPSNYANLILFIDLDSVESYTLFLSQIKELGMTKTGYEYVLLTLGIHEIELSDFIHGGSKITGFSIIDYYNINTIKTLSDIIKPDEPLNKMSSIPHQIALLIDGLVFFSKRINPLIGANMSSLFGLENVSLRRAEIYVNKNRGINCSFDPNNKQNKWPLGSFILNNLKTNTLPSFEGLTGLVSFDQNGKRKNYTIGIYTVELNRQVSKIGFYSSEKGLTVNEILTHSSKSKQIQTEDSQHKQKKVVISILDEPFFMIRPEEPGKNWTGNDRYMGYCVDLAKRIAEMVNFTYELRLVRDGNFGTRDANGNWNGLVGELVRNEADIAIAPLTISSMRERAIEFSTPFMDIGISIMIKKPKKEKPGVFSFMSPLDTAIWMCVILAYISVSIILYLICRFSPFEWHYDPKKNEKGLSNDFSILNTLWFNLAAVMQQGVDFAPRSTSARLVASAWWFFTLILISSYTANLAAFLTVERMVSPIESAEDLVKQTEIQYGAVEGGSTKEFFRASKVPTYNRMWNFMNSWGSNVFVKNNFEGLKKVRDSKGKYAFLLESSVNEYLNERKECDTMKVGENLDQKGYGVATPIRSELREAVNLAILQLKEEGYLDELKSRWWYDRSECGSSTNSKEPTKNSLNLINVAGIFYILIIGLIMSVLIATLELVYKAKIQAKKNNTQLAEAIKSKMRLSITGYEDNFNETHPHLPTIDTLNVDN